MGFATFSGGWWSCRASVKLERVLCSAEGPGALSFKEGHPKYKDELTSKEKQSVLSELLHHGHALGFTCDTFLHCLLISWDIYSEKQVYTKMIPPLFSSNFRSSSVVGLQLWRTSLASKKGWKKPLGKMSRAEGCPSPQNRPHSRAWQQDLLSWWIHEPQSTPAATAWNY